MEDIQKEKQEEEELLKKTKEQKEEEVKAAIISEYGLDPVDNEALIASLTKNRIEDMKRFGELVGQKRKHREAREIAEAKLKELETDPSKKGATPQAPAFTKEEILKEAEDRAFARMQESQFDSSDLPDDIKAEVKSLAKMKGLSFAKALEDPYIKFKINEAVKDGKITEAAISRTNRSATTEAKEEGLTDSMKKFDLNTPEGRQAWVDSENKKK